MADKQGWYWVQCTPGSRVVMAYVWTFPNEQPIFRDMSTGEKGTRFVSDVPDARWQYIPRPDTLHVEGEH